MDKELDDLLDSALDDFDKKLNINQNLAENKKPDEIASSSSSISIQRTNIYVDDELDDEDRPPATLNKPVKLTKSDLEKKEPELNQATSDASKSKDPFLNLLNDTSSGLNDENMKLFEDIFNDEKTKESMKQFKEVFEKFKDGDEASLFQNFEKVMSELTNIEDLDIDDSDLDMNLGNMDLFKNMTSISQKKTDSNKTKETSSSTTEKESKPTADSASNSDGTDKNETNTFSKILDEMNKNSEKILKNPSNSFPFSADFLSTLNSLGDDNSNENDDNLDSATSLMMQPILSMLFSKDILYPSLKLMLENYDKYIEEKRSSLSEDELKKCYNQKECIAQMCSVYDQAKESDSKQEKAEQLKKILDLLEKCGMPPQELVPEVNPFEGLGDFKGTDCPIS